MQPPATFTFIHTSQQVEHDAAVELIVIAIGEPIWEMVTLAESVQPRLSVMVTIYDPAQRLFMNAVESPFDQL